MISRLPLFLLTLICSQASLGCALHDSRSEAIYRLNLTDAECRTISYVGGSVIPILISYPHGDVVTYAWKGKKIHVRIYYSDDYEISRFFNYAKYLRTENEMEVYETFKKVNFVFRGTDQATVIVNQMGSTWLARRMSAKGLVVMYQYDDDIKTFKEVDALVQNFIMRVLGEKE
ncbi:hypothetical protein [Pseudomonas sp. HMSC08G10]|uniref:hypothetical protein n=1 Tax=Pseudomonas sp. HMSC08G10 TaxID=1581141 RepID=UPI0011130857|nr:hypothetical protein [Pseudomonas sp. HMSC08G10]